MKDGAAALPAGVEILPPPPPVVRLAVSDKAFVPGNELHTLPHEPGRGLGYYLDDVGFTVPDGYYPIVTTARAVEGGEPEIAAVEIEDWDTTPLDPEDLVMVNLLPGDDRQQTGTFSAVIALALSRIPVVGPLVAVLFLVAAQFAFSRIFAPESPETLEQKFSPALSPRGLRNEIDPFGLIPRNFGKNRIWPKKAGVPVVDTAGGEQFLRELFLVSMGEHVITDMKIADTPIAEFADAETVIHPTFKAGDTLSIYSNDIDVESFNILLDKDTESNDGAFSTRRTQPDVDEIQIDLFAPSWTSISTLTNRSIQISAVVEVEYQSTSGGGFIKPVFLENAVSLDGQFAIQLNTQNPVFISRRWTVARDTYDVRMKRRIIVTADEPVWRAKYGGLTANGIVNKRAGKKFFRVAIRDDLFWVALRSQRDVAPISLAKTMTVIELRIRASNQLQGQLDQFNCIASSKLPTWNGSIWTAPVETARAAWAFAEVLRGESIPVPLADSRIDETQLKVWADSGRDFHGLVDFRGNVKSLLRTITGVGRAMFVFNDLYEYSVALDETQASPKGVFTPHNSFGFRSERVLFDAPDAIRAQFSNADNGYEQDEVLVIRSGVDPNALVRIDTQRIFGINDPGDVQIAVRRNFLVLEHRPDLFRFKTDLEHLTVKPGDRILHHHIVLGDAAGSGRITAASTTQITINELAPLEAAKSYAVRFRYDDGTVSAAFAIDSPPSDNRIATFTFTTPIGAPSVPAVGDITIVGETVSVGLDMLVVAIRPAGDQEAEIELTNYAEAIQTGDALPAPPFKTLITRPPLIRAKPEAPRIANVRSDETALFRDIDGSLKPRIAVDLERRSNTAALPSHYRIAVRPFGQDGFDQRPDQPGDANTITIDGVVESEGYDIEIRAVSVGGIASDPAIIFKHIVVGKTTPPPDVTGLILEGTRLTWIYDSAPRDLQGFLVRARIGSSVVWDGAQKLHQGVVSQTLFDVSHAPAGTTTLMVKAVDTAGNESVNPAFIVRNLGGIIIGTLLFEFDHRAAGFPGTIVNGTVVGGDLLADTDATLMWTADDSSPLWSGDDSLFLWGGSNLEMTYSFSFVPAIFPSRLSLSVGIIGDPFEVTYRRGDPAPLWSGVDATPLWSGDDSKPMWGGVGDVFRPWPGSLDAVFDLYEFKIRTGAGRLRGKITELKVRLDLAA